MKIFRVLVLAVALIAGGGAAYLAINMLPESATEMAVTPTVPMTDVLVAAADISPGRSWSEFCTIQVALAARQARQGDGLHAANFFLGEKQRFLRQKNGQYSVSLTIL